MGPEAEGIIQVQIYIILLPNVTLHCPLQVVEFLEEAGSPLPDIIVGADVILWPAYTRALLLTVRWLLALKPRYNMTHMLVG